MSCNSLTLIQTNGDFLRHSERKEFLYLNNCDDMNKPWTGALYELQVCVVLSLL